MFDVGFWELLLLFGLALLVLGPERLPRVARQVGTWAGRARVMARSLRVQLENEVDLQALKERYPAKPPNYATRDEAATDSAEEETAAGDDSPDSPEPAHAGSDTSRPGHSTEPAEEEIVETGHQEFEPADTGPEEAETAEPRKDPHEQQ